MEPDEDKVWSSKREKTVAVERKLLCVFWGWFQVRQQEGKKEHGLNGVTHIRLDLVCQ